MTRRQYAALVIGWLMGLLFATAPVAHAQSTGAGRSFFSAFDTWRERQPWLPAWLDDQDWKTWIWHGAFTEAGGQVLRITTPMSAKTGRRTLAAFYVARELYNIAFENNRKYGDAFLDALVPILVAETRLHIRIRVTR